MIHLIFSLEFINSVFVSYTYFIIKSIIELFSIISISNYISNEYIIFLTSKSFLWFNSYLLLLMSSLWFSLKLFVSSFFSSCSFFKLICFETTFIIFKFKFLFYEALFFAFFFFYFCHYYLFDSCMFLVLMQQVLPLFFHQIIFSSFINQATFVFFPLDNGLSSL